jgi:hypothetical protein
VEIPHGNWFASGARLVLVHIQLEPFRLVVEKFFRCASHCRMRYRSRQDHRLCLDCVYTWPWISTPNRAAITQTIEAVTASSRRRGRADGRKATARFADLGSWGRSPGRPKIGDAFLNGRAHLAHGTDLAGLAPGNSRRLKKGNPPPNVRRAGGRATSMPFQDWVCAIMRTTPISDGKPQKLLDRIHKKLQEKNPSMLHLRTTSQQCGSGRSRSVEYSEETARIPLPLGECRAKHHPGDKDPVMPASS